LSNSFADEVFRKLSTLSKDQFREEAYKIVSKNNPTSEMSWTMHPEKTRLRPTGITISFI
jgi:hypothetical protein